LALVREDVLQARRRMRACLEVVPRDDHERFIGVFAGLYHALCAIERATEAAEQTAA
jgi:hypothetical protein